MKSHLHVTHPTAIVVFGGTGDLARTKLLPALLDLFVAGQLPERFVVLGFSRRQFSDTEYQAFVYESIQQKGHDHSTAMVREFCAHIQYVTGSFTDVDAYDQVKKVLQDYDDSLGQCTNKLFYLAVPPQHYEVIFEQLAASNAMALCDNRSSWARVLVEKPFGHDLTTAQMLEKKLCEHFAEEQIYRIDHYLAKDAIENIIALRLMNSVLANSWGGHAIESMHIKLFEHKDVSNRGSFFDAIGSLRDVGQNHLLQIFALLTMNPVDVHDPQAVRAARADALRLLQRHTITDVSRGQYEGYTATPGVAAQSDTETYFRLRFSLESDEWSDTTFTLEAGKALDQRVNEAIITFRPHNLCHCAAAREPHEHRNTLTIQFAPTQHICLCMWTKEPGFTFTLREQELTLVSTATDASHTPDAYERVLFDCIAGDQTRFVSGDEVEFAWRFITPILEQFKTISLSSYAPGTSGPKGAS